MTKDLASPTWRKVIIWGAGAFGEQCLAVLHAKDIEVIAFVDRSPPESGQVQGIPALHSPKFVDDIALAKQADAIIFAMCADPRPMQKDLREKGFTGAFAVYVSGMPENEFFSQKRQLMATRLFVGNAETPSSVDDALLKAVECRLLAFPRIGFYGGGAVARYLLQSLPCLTKQVTHIFDDSPELANTRLCGIPVLPLQEDTPVDLIFITAVRYLDRVDIHHRIAAVTPSLRTLDWEALANELPHSTVPQSAFQDLGSCIYPVDIPPLKIEKNKDFILMDMPARFMGLLPNGVGYVHKILQKTGCNFQTIDLDLIFYHRYHSHRILDGYPELFTPSGKPMPSDPWAMDKVEEFWQNRECVDYFLPEIERIIAELQVAKPKMIGLSIHQTNRLLSKDIITRLRVALPEALIVVGGYDCINPETAPHAVGDFDHMVVFEAENSLPLLIQALLEGKKRFHIPGIISKTALNSPLGHTFVPGELPTDLDEIGYPTYDWTDIRLYRNFNHYQLIPVLLSRGCRWSKCTFCGERFDWRRRSPSSVADEIEWFVDKGGRIFLFNDSDLSGDPAAVRAMCEEIIKRNIKGIVMGGQLRVQKGYNQEYFEVLKEAGFQSLRYGIDGWAKNTLKLHKKGYTINMIEKTIEMTKAAGLVVAINLVIGIPFETEKDIDETIDNMVRNRHNFDMIENINTLVLNAGSIYHAEPEKHGIKFNGDKAQIYRDHPTAVPSQLWYSVDPYIDQEVRRHRLHRILEAAEQHGIKFGGYADWKAKKLSSET
jgi:hypothetical protein